MSNDGCVRGKGRAARYDISLLSSCLSICTNVNKDAVRPIRRSLVTRI